MSAKRLLYVFMVAVLLSPLFTCRMDAGFAPPTTSAGLPADKVLDVARSYNGPFTYETMLPVALSLTVELYEQPSPAAALERQASGGQLIVVSLWNKDGASLYSGSVPSGGTLATVLALPSAPQDVVLRLESPGYEPREVTIAGMVLYSEVNRVMGLLADDSSARAILPDTDQDGVPDIYDVDPLDPESAFKVRNPATGLYTVAFEDLYPVPGDADYNDFVANYFIEENHKAVVEPNKELLTEVQEKPIEVLLNNMHGEATAVAKIAGYSHKFGIVIDFPGRFASRVTRVYYDANGNRQTASQDNVADRAVIWLFEDTSKSVTGKKALFDIIFPKGVTRDMVSVAPYDPVLYVRNTGKDIHMVGKDPLDGSAAALAAELSYMDSNGYPWALLVPEDWQHPAETQYIGKAYPLFDEWRASKGAAAPYWYLYPASTSSVPGNNQPAKVSSADSTELTAGSGSSQFFQLSSTDPDGDTVEFLCSPAPVALQELFHLNADTGLVTFDPKVPEGDYLFYFWSVDEHGASNLATPFKAAFSFRNKTTTGYPRIVIETFSPNGDYTADTYIDLFGANGDPDADDPWTGNDTADAIAYDDNGSTDWAMMSRIDYTKGLDPGTYYIRVRGSSPEWGIYEYYAIRVLALPLGDALPAYPKLEPASIPDAGEVDDNPTSGGIPEKPVAIDLSTPLSRTLYRDGKTSDIDWFKLVLP